MYIEGFVPPFFFNLTFMAFLTSFSPAAALDKPFQCRSSHFIELVAG